MIQTLLSMLILTLAMTVVLAGCQISEPSSISGMKPEMSSQVLARHPASQALGRLFPPVQAPVPKEFKSTGMKREDYLSLVAGNVDFYKQHQNAAGAIIDPVQRKEIQYSTPAFALAAATLVTEKKRDDLLDPAIRAMTFATSALASRRAADSHGDFYIPLLMHARRVLKSRVPRETLAAWDADFARIIPEKIYSDTTARLNWNLVNVGGEALRAKDGLVATTQATTQRAYIERSIAKQMSRMTRFGLYADPDVPLAYDAFTRLWLEDMMADNAYDGAHAAEVRDFLLAGGLSSLLMISPTGEWPSGGRSAHHQWNEAQNIVILEINATKWKKLGRDDIAGAMKRTAHLCYESMKRWQRPTGEMWIVKNRAEPDTRLGYERYSSHSQYNLLPMGMLCIAYARADESIRERPTPCETGGYVLDLREKFHKIIANAGGMYVQIDTAADAHYNATGLQRVHKAGVPLSPLSDSTAAHRTYGPSVNKTAIAMSPTIQWTNSPPTIRPVWKSMADFVNPTEPAPAKGDGVVEAAELQVRTETPEKVEFAVQYRLKGEAAFVIEEQYQLTPNAVDGVWRIASAPSDLTNVRVLFPALVNNGADDLYISTKRGLLEINREGSRLRFEVLNPTNVLLRQEGPRVPSHNGFARAVVGEIGRLKAPLVWRITLENERR